jgi:hypothetical protein
MAIFGTVFRSLQERQVPFLLIGGHAIVLLGHPRNTFDLDLLIPESSLENAREALLGLGYQKYFETGAFLQLTPPSSLAPVDLMIVDDATFIRLKAFAEQRTFDGETVSIPDALRMVALKLHATRSTSRLRREIDWEDIAGILRTAKKSLDDPEYQEIVFRYGGSEAIAEIRRRIGD